MRSAKHSYAHAKVEPKDMDKVAEQEQAERMAAYEKRLAEQGGGDFFKPPMVKDNEIKIIKFTKFLVENPLSVLFGGTTPKPLPFVESKGDYSNPEYLAAVAQFYR
jgi:hypothetical protein